VTPHSFVLFLVLASAVLAFWIGARFPELGPKTFAFGLLHLFAGFAAIRAIPGLTNAATAYSTEVAKFLAPFGIALPLFTYAFLTGLWLARLIHRSTTSGLPH
jgi:nitrate reductase gamma subunit